MSKSFHILSFMLLFWLAFGEKGRCCRDEYPTHNYYMVSFAERRQDRTPFQKEIDAFWHDYTKGKYDCYPIYDVTGLRAYIKSLDDNEMLTYVKDLNEYLDICNEFFIDRWEYPDKEELAMRDSLISCLQARSKSYKGSRFRAQYHLMYMRCLMLLKKWDEAKSYWLTKGKRLPQSVYRSMMENIYAGALFHTGEMELAFAIFSRQGDDASIRWSMRKYRGLAGIQKIYTNNPNSPSLPYLLQDFVNNVQETIDQEHDDIPLGSENFMVINADDARRFCAIADSVLEEGKVTDPCMWATSQSMVYHLLKDHENAFSSISRALAFNGSARTKANCRCVNILIQSSSPDCDLNWLIGELRWLEAQCKTETSSDYCYSNAFDRIMMNSLSPMLHERGDENLSLAVDGMYNEITTQLSTSHHRSAHYDYEERGESTWNEDYQNEFINTHLYTMSASACEAYYRFITDTHPDAFSQYVCSRVFKDKNFFNDFIGTKYMAEAKFEQAIPYLEQVDLSYLSQLNISYYMQNRDYWQERWLSRQSKKDDYSKEGMHHITFTQNPRLKFCRDVLSLQKSYSKHSMSEKGNLIAYQLATLYYQASYKGDCWWLISYKNSSNPYVIEQDHAGENDFIKSSEVYLRSCLDTKDDKLLGKCLYALAFAATDNWLTPKDLNENGYFEEDQMEMIPNPMSEKYACLDDLNRYYESHKENAPAYMSKCDVLTKFRKMKWLMDY
mgnify:CR=1 FL=1